MTTETPVKVSAKVTSVIELLDNWHKARGMYLRHKHILNSPLPPKKKKHHSAVFAIANIRFINAANKFQSAYDKLKEGEKRELYDLTAGKY